MFPLSHSLIMHLVNPNLQDGKDDTNRHHDDLNAETVGVTKAHNVSIDQGAAVSSTAYNGLSLA